MKFSFEIEVRPEFELPALEGIPVTKPGRGDRSPDRSGDRATPAVVRGGPRARTGWSRRTTKWSPTSACESS